MKLVWSPEMAAKAFMDTVKSCDLHQGSSITELISAMAAGWNAKLIVETWNLGDPTTTSLGLAVASTHTNGRHICIVPDEHSKTEYISAMKKSGMSPEVLIGEPKIVLKDIEFIDFLVVDCKNNEIGHIIKAAKFGPRGAVLACMNVSLVEASGFGLRGLFENGGLRRIVRSVFLPVGNGLDIGYVAGVESGSGSGSGSGSDSGKMKNRRWIKRVDRESGEEFLIRK